MTTEALSLRVACAQARYDWQADVSALAGRFTRFLNAGVFAPGASLVGEDRLALPCALPPRETAAGGAARPFAGGVFFPQALEAREPVPAMGLPPAPDALTFQPLRVGEGCAVGFIDLAAHLRPGTTHPHVDYARLRRTVHTAVHFLDNCIDVADYPSEACSRACRASRKLALGAFGLAEMLADVGVAYDSDAGRALAVKVFSFLTGEARAASRALAGLRGPFPLFADSRLADGAPVRNAMVTGLAPCAAEACTHGRTPGIEPKAGSGVSLEARLRMQAAVAAHVDGTAALPLCPAGGEAARDLCVQACRLGCTLVQLCGEEDDGSAPPCPADEPLPEAAFPQGDSGRAAAVPEETAQALPPDLPPPGEEEALPIRYCPRCGRPVQQEPGGPRCPACGPLL